MARAGKVLGAVLLAAALGGDSLAAVVRVSVASSLLPALRDAARAYRSLQPDVELQLGGGASGLLVQQVRRGAPIDVLICASAGELDTLQELGRVAPRDRSVIAGNRLVVLVPSGRTPPASVEGLVDPAFRRIAVGNPKTAPVGRYARQALSTLRLWDPLQDRLVYAENARQALEYVARGEVDAAVVYLTDTRIRPEAVRRGPLIPTDLHEPILYEAALLSGAQRRPEAEAFVRWMHSEGGARLLRRHGFAEP